MKKTAKNAKKPANPSRMTKKRGQRDKTGKFLPGFTANPFGLPKKKLTQSEVFQELLACSKIKIELYKSIETKTPINNKNKVINWNTEDINLEKKVIEYDVGETNDFRRLIFITLLQIMLNGGREGVLAAQELLRRGDARITNDDGKNISDMTMEEIEEEIKSIDDTTRKLIEFKKTAS